MILFRGEAPVFLGTYWHYLFYGDKRIIEANYEAGKRYLEHLKNESKCGRIFKSWAMTGAIRKMNCA